MDICKIEGFTRVLGAPEGWDHSKVECQGLPIYDHPDGWMVSAWKPDAVELAALNEGGSIQLWIAKGFHPVVGLSVADAVGEVFVQDAPKGVVQELAARNSEVKLLRMTIQRMQETLSNQGRMCTIALAATGEQNSAGDI
jgi:hypothetical protein